MKTARVRDFHAILISYLTQYDQKESMRELKRSGRENIYRLGHLLKAADTVRMVSQKLSIWGKDSQDALQAYRVVLMQGFLWENGKFALSPLRQLERQINARINTGRLPTYGKLRANPNWTAVFE